jgi:hypothetical protein
MLQLMIKVLVGWVFSPFTGDSEIRCLAILSNGKVVLAGEESGHIHFLKLEGV